MSRLSRFSSFPPAGSPSWVLGEDPVWRGGVAPGVWWPARAAWTADFANDRYMQAGAQISRGALLSCVRSSAALEADAAGAVHVVAANETAVVDGGAAIWGQFTQLLSSPFDFTAAAWTKAGVNSITQMSGYQLFADLDASATAQLSQIVSHSADALKRTSWCILKKDAENSVLRSFTAYTTGGTLQQHLVTINTSTGAWASYDSAKDGAAAVYDLGFGWLIAITIANNGTNTGRAVVCRAARATTMQGATANSLTGSVGIYCAGGVVGNVFPPFLSGSKLADDVTATSFSWFANAGLASGASELIVPKWSHVGDGVNRPLFEYSDGTANNSIKGYINPSDKPALKIVAGGVTQTDTALSVSIAAGRRPLVFGWSAAGGYVADSGGAAATFGAVALPGGLSQKRIGGSVASNFLNDRLERLSASRPLTQAEAQTWVGAA